MTVLYEQLTPVEVIKNANNEQIIAALASNRPVILKQLVNHWPITQASKSSSEEAIEYLKSLASDIPVSMGSIDAKYQGRLFYNEDFTGFNFSGSATQFKNFLDELMANSKKTSPKGMYLGSTNVNRLIPGFLTDNNLTCFDKQPLTNIWVSNQTRVSAHFDTPYNIACCVTGKRRFTLFPPEQIANLYIGPLDKTPAGQAISLVDFNNIDHDKFPKFAQALKAAQVAELDEGDALIVPSMWWHHVEGLMPINILINFWWQDAPAHTGDPLDALLLALMNIKTLPKEQRASWQKIFQHYIFEDNDFSYMPEHAKGVLAPENEHSSRYIRALLLNKLNR